MWNMTQMMLLFGMTKIVIKEAHEKMWKLETYFPMLKKGEEKEK